MKSKDVIFVPLAKWAETKGVSPKLAISWATRKRIPAVRLKKEVELWHIESDAELPVPKVKKKSVV